jgi:hypothetical protein
MAIDHRETFTFGDFPGRVQFLGHEIPCRITMETILRVAINPPQALASASASAVLRDHFLHGLHQSPSDDGRGILDHRAALGVSPGAGAIQGHEALTVEVFAYIETASFLRSSHVRRKGEVPAFEWHSRRVSQDYWLLG